MGRLDQTSMVPSARSHLGSCIRGKRASCGRNTAAYRAPGVFVAGAGADRGTKRRSSRNRCGYDVTRRAEFSW